MLPTNSSMELDFEGVPDFDDFVGFDCGPVSSPQPEVNESFFEEMGQLYDTQPLIQRLDAHDSRILALESKITMLTAQRVAQPTPSRGKGKGKRVVAFEDDENEEEEEEKPKPVPKGTPRRPRVGDVAPAAPKRKVVESFSSDEDGSDDDNDEHMIDYRRAGFTKLKFPRVLERSLPPPHPSKYANAEWTDDPKAGPYDDSWPDDDTSRPLYPKSRVLRPRTLAAADYDVIVLDVNNQLWSLIRNSMHVTSDNIRVAALGTVTFPIVHLEAVHNDIDMERVRKFFPSWEKLVFMPDKPTRFRSNVHAEVYNPHMIKMRICIFPNEIADDGRIAPLAVDSTRMINNLFSHLTCPAKSFPKLRPAVYFGIKWQKEIEDRGCVEEEEGEVEEEEDEAPRKGGRSENPSKKLRKGR